MVINNAFNVSMKIFTLHNYSEKIKVLINMLRTNLLTFESFVDSSAFSIAFQIICTSQSFYCFFFVQSHTLIIFWLLFLVNLAHFICIHYFTYYLFIIFIYLKLAPIQLLTITVLMQNLFSFNLICIFIFFVNSNLLMLDLLSLCLCLFISNCSFHMLLNLFRMFLMLFAQCVLINDICMQSL